MDAGGNACWSRLLESERAESAADQAPSEERWRTILHRIGLLHRMWCADGCGAGKHFFYYDFVGLRWKRLPAKIPLIIRIPESVHFSKRQAAA